MFLSLILYTTARTLFIRVYVRVVVLNTTFFLPCLARRISFKRFLEVFPDFVPSTSLCQYAVCSTPISQWKKQRRVKANKQFGHP